jgi:stearoyl-CoA desaturase (delta-9 desaturase)
VGAGPAVVIQSDGVFTSKRRIALVTIWVPTLGAAAAAGLAFTRGITWVEPALLFGMYALTMFGVEVGFHRAFSHRAFRSSTAFRWVMAVCGSMAAQGNILYWVATHRRHHAHSDTANDPHSPHWRLDRSGPEKLGGLRGLWHAQMGNMYTDDATNCTMFAKDFLRDPVMMRVSNQYRMWVVVGLVIPAVVGGIAHGSMFGALEGLLWGGLGRIFLGHHCYFTNGSLSHYYGGRPFDTGDMSTNNHLCAIPTFGSAFQNNHHAFPSSARLGLQPWEIDLGGYIIGALQVLGIATDVKQVSPEVVKAARERARPVRGDLQMETVAIEDAGA